MKTGIQQAEPLRPNAWLRPLLIGPSFAVSGSRDVTQEMPEDVLLPGRRGSYRYAIDINDFIEQAKAAAELDQWTYRPS